MVESLNVLLCCNLGASTGVMVSKMREIANGSKVLENVPVKIEAHPASDIKEYIDQFDVVLIGPQIKHRYSELQEVCDKHNKPIEVIDPRDYGMVNGANILKQAMYLRIKYTENQEGK